jgi:hypothetical protein
VPTICRQIGGMWGEHVLCRRIGLLERSSAHGHETGAVRRTHLCDRGNIPNRLLVHVAGCNVSLLLSRVLGAAPRGFQDLAATIFDPLNDLIIVVRHPGDRLRRRVIDLGAFAALPAAP